MCIRDSLPVPRHRPGLSPGGLRDASRPTARRTAPTRGAAGPGPAAPVRRTRPVHRRRAHSPRQHRRTVSRAGPVATVRLVWPQMVFATSAGSTPETPGPIAPVSTQPCLLYTSDAADEEDSVDL